MVDILCWLVSLYIVVIIVTMVMSWFPLTSDGLAYDIYRWGRRVTDPVMMPVRKVIPPFGGIDITPFLVIVVLERVVLRLILDCGLAL